MSERDLYGVPPADESETEPARPLPRQAPRDQGEEWSGEVPALLRPAEDGVSFGEETLDDLDTPPAAEPDSSGGGSVALGALAGLLAAIAGAVAWGLIADWTDRELAVVAWGVGVLVACAIRLVAGRGGPDLQMIAVVESAAAILVGKYLAFVFVFRSAFGTNLGIFSADTLDVYRNSLADVFGLVDVLWIALALASAWTILLTADESEAARGAPAEATRDYHTRNPVDRLTRGLPRSLRVTIDWLVTIAGAVAIVLLVKAYVVNPYRIPSSSMEPTLHCARPGNDCEARFSDRVLANRFVYHLRDPKRGEIVVFETPPKACGVGGTFVKRVIGLPGEKFEVRLIKGDGYVFINGKRLNEPYVRPDRRQLSSSFGPVTVPQDHYFMLGDNREQSCDSREWGALPRENLIGKVFATYWPPQRLSLH